MNTPVTSIYQQVIERAKGLNFRSGVLTTAIKRREAQAASKEVTA